VLFDPNVDVALADVRDDHTPTQWMIAGYSDDNTVTHQRSGEGDIQEFLNSLDESQVQYGLFRVSEVMDRSTTIKFGFIKLMPQEAITPMKRARFTTHQGTVQLKFKPNHYEFFVERASELTPDEIMTHISGLTGTLSHVVENKQQGYKPKKKDDFLERKSDAGPRAAANEAVIKFENEDDFKDAMMVVRNDRSEITWMLAGMGRDLKLRVLGRGVGEVQDMLAPAEDNLVNFGLLRVTDQIDNSTTVKFVYVVYMHDDIPAMLKAKVGTLGGKIQDAFRPMHCDVWISRRDEITQAQVLDKVGAYSGSKSHVLVVE